MKVASIILIVGFLSIIINQGIWIYNMKKTYYEDYSLFFNNLLNIYVQQERVGSLPFDLFEMDKYLQKRLDALNLMFIYKLELYENGRMVNTIGCDVKKEDDYVYISPCIKISDALSLQCSTVIPSSFIIGKMKRINDISCWAMVISIGCLIYLLLNILKREKMLKSNMLAIY